MIVFLMFLTAVCKNFYYKLLPLTLIANPSAMAGFKVNYNEEKGKGHNTL